MQYILLAGIHGVGKSTLLQQINEVYPIESHTISSLIKKASSQKTTNTSKRTGQINKNQDLWKKELKNIKTTSQKIILDGHFSLLNSQGDIVALPLETFDNVNISGVILKQEKPEIVRSRLLQRDNFNWDVAKIKTFQEVEEKSAKKYSLDTNTPLYIYNDDKLLDDLISFINER
ncbi:ATP-binding protein [Listeria innocua]|nr:AAA family ATPase [Listeria innocua]